MNQDNRFKITIRLIKSFEFSNVKYLVVPDLDADTTFLQLGEKVREILAKDPTGVRYKPFEKYDTFKIYVYPMSAKPITLVINTNHPEWMVTDQSDTLGKWGLGMEAEVSYFNKEEFFKIS
eukprot:gnl/Chilomastix_caulleri/3023.p1 GENE.gnl/Chilomastix_caulleri/3023~~gnl/Chilomastix_caulleri/3023.p1  ORF type:complete len:121 (+),score=6.48 gnl/Chilomastix_caulleri/3023:100-462(+)